MTRAEIDSLDHGIRALVVFLNEQGFETTDSGDGASKHPDDYVSGCAMPFPHVVARLPNRGELQRRRTIERDALRMAALCGEGWVVELSFATDSKNWVLFAHKSAPHPLEAQR